MILAITDSTNHSIDVQLPDECVNYWDADPKAHGGLFTRFEDTHLTAVETIPPSAIPDDVYEDRHIVYEHYGHYDELIHSSDCEDRPSDILGRELDSLHNCEGLQHAAVDGMLPSALAWCLTRTHSGHEQVVSDSEYIDTLQDCYSVPEELLQ